MSIFILFYAAEQETVRIEMMLDKGRHVQNPIPKQLAKYFVREDTPQETKEGRCGVPEKHSVVQK